ncbi:MAG: aldehyde dehydrogenase family protein [Chloroflexi bacterium]|nr:aldehyde dehydrogenase family protein [Chloroflexota bacterium]OJV95320.1 MAG: hypothetical protein BGO39_25320 [Chloroflexi bacterium 54-19]
MDVNATLLIDGNWRSTPIGSPVINPATGAVLTVQANAGTGETKEAIAAAANAFKSWRATSGFARSEIMTRAAALIGARAETIGRTLALETGKLLREAIGEVRFAADYFAWFAGEARRLEGLSGFGGRAGGQQLVLHKPLGVVGVLTPWNFPVSIQARKIAPALAAGCTVVGRPSELAPNSVVELYQCLQEAGVPAGVINLVTGPAAPITEALLEAYEVRAITFTGSTPVGKMLYTRSAQTMKRLALELGGAAPFIVCADADLSLALDQAVIAKFRNYGQSCVGANIFYVDQSQYSAFLEGFSARVKALKPGDPLQPETTFGPLINAKRVQAIRDLQKAGEEAGFEHIAAAPDLSAAPGAGLSPELYFPPALFAAPALDRVDQAFLNQEIFGPLAYVVGYSNLDELLDRLCQNPLGLAGYVFSENTAQALRIAARLELGITGINDGLPSAANAPMGGVKDSGLGREGGHQGIEEFMDLQYIALGKPLLA